MTTSATSYVTRFNKIFRGPVSGTGGFASDVRAGVADLAGGLVWLKEQFYDLVMGAEQRVIGRSGDLLEITGHGLASNTAVRIFATYGGSIPAPLTEQTVYYIRDIDADRIELSASSGPGAAITLTSGISGDVWIQTVPDWISNALVSNATYGSGKLKDLIVWLAGAQTVTGAKTFAGQLTIGGTNTIGLASRATTRVAGNIATDDGVGILLPTTGQSVDVEHTIDIPIDPPHGSSIKAYRVWVNPGTHGSLPAIMPGIVLGSYSADGSISALISLYSDPSADTTTYNALHAIERTSVAVPIDRTQYRYFIRYSHEAGAGSVAGDVCGASFDVQMTSMDYAAG